MTKPCLPGLFSADVQLRDPMRFDGATIEPAVDAPRLGGQLRAVLQIMSTGSWITLAALAGWAQCSEASASARLRDLRKKRHGGYVVERKRIGQSGLFRYRLSK